jgi:hypothetical protein
MTFANFQLIIWNWSSFLWLSIYSNTFQDKLGIEQFVWIYFKINSNQFLAPMIAYQFNTIWQLSYCIATRSELGKSVFVPTPGFFGFLEAIASLVVTISLSQSVSHSVRFSQIRLYIPSFHVSFYSIWSHSTAYHPVPPCTIHSHPIPHLTTLFHHI